MGKQNKQKNKKPKAPTKIIENKTPTKNESKKIAALKTHL